MMQMFTKGIISFLMLLLLGVVPAMAQIKNLSDDKQKKEQRRFLKEAEKTESTYKDSHLNTNAYTFKKGEAARKRVKKRDERRQYKFDEAGKPLKKKTFLRRKTTSKQAGR
ncbi:hypothetical protein [Pontibacter populi]|uniref:hypothetical protein n=1 Tax=Pontibacter populi TaxID=890055 RepID=UPI001C5AEEBC|nr:hypothetical protein [Pontibacter populi]